MQDVQEWLLNRYPRGGSFVEAGAHDGVGDSQTLRLERAGWTGLCVEPSSYFAGLVGSRKCRVDNRALWREDGSVEFVDIPATELSGIPRCFGDHWDRSKYGSTRRTVQCVTLPHMLKSRAFDPLEPITFLCLDTEGSELDILRAHDFERFPFLTMLVEHNGVEQRRRDLHVLADGAGHELVWDDGTNGFYKLRGAVERTT
jgi:hypothetical protein